MWRCAALILWPRLLTMYAYLMILRSISFWNCKVSFTCSISECVKLLEIWFYIIVRALSLSYTQSVCRSVLVHFFVFGLSKISLYSTSKFQEVLWWFDLFNLFSWFTVISIGFPDFSMMFIVQHIVALVIPMRGIRHILWPGQKLHAASRLIFLTYLV